MRDPETGEITTEDCNACDPPVLVRDSEVWLEGRVSAKDSHLKSSSVSDLSNVVLPSIGMVLVFCF